MKNLVKLFALWAGLLVILQPAKAQYFGQNKVGYQTFHFKVLQTQNFALHHYTPNDSIANHWANQSERWYAKLQQVLRDSIPFRNPIIFYNSHADFQQTNVTPGNIDPGTGGFAEGMKNRIVMPMMKANAQTDHVLGHEIVHAIQFQMMMNNGDSLSLRNMMSLPLWFIEGMAEYLSIGAVDSHTALWLRDAVQNNNLPTINDLTINPRFFPYRWGHAFWAFVTGTWGEAVIRPLFLTAGSRGYEQAIQQVLGVSVREFNQRWHESLRQTYIPFASQPYTPQRVLANNVVSQMQLAPALSPDGRFVAFLSEKNLFSLDMFLADAQTGRVLRKLGSTTRNPHFDAISYLESTGTWSPDSRQFMFTVFARGKNRLVIVNARNGRIAREIEIPGVPAFSNPSWSPDGQYVVVNGLVNGQNDLYLYNLRNRTVRQLTNDRASELQPSWSPDGRTLVFVTDAPAKRDNRPFAFEHRLVLYDLPTQVKRVLPIFVGADNLNPTFGTDNQMIYFLSDRDGYRNIYAYNPYRNQAYQLTRYFTGVTGITPHAPALSISRETGQLVYTVFERQGYQMYRAEGTELLWERVNTDALDMVAATLPPMPRFKKDFVSARLNATKAPEPYQPFPELIESKPYRPRLDLVGISGGTTGGAGISSNRLGTTLQGGVNAFWTDMLGNKQLGVGLAMTGRLSDISGQITYMNRKRRINWGVGLSHVGFSTARGGFGLDTLTANDGQRVPVIARFLDEQRTFEQQLSFFSYLPISRTRRVELTASGSRFSFRTIRNADYFFNGRQVFDDRFRLPNPADIFLGSVGAAYVGDNTNLGPVSPIRGQRFRFGIEASYGPVQFQTLTADYRHYFRVAPFTIATRGFYLGRTGRDASTGFLPPLFVGVPTLIRGYANQQFVNPDAARVSLSDLQGRNMAVGNVELRFPLTGNPRIAAFRSGFFQSELSLFADAGMAWGRPVPPRNIMSAAEADRAWRPVPATSTGVSLRLNLLGAIILEPFYAIPWQYGGGFRNGTFGLNIAAGW
ncbi:MAG: BamA/TamA family outer membrane protein [Runella sp.]